MDKEGVRKGTRKEREVIGNRKFPNYREVILRRSKCLLQYLETFLNGDIAKYELNERDMVQSKKNQK